MWCSSGKTGVDAWFSSVGAKNGCNDSASPLFMAARQRRSSRSEAHLVGGPLGLFLAIPVTDTRPLIPSPITDTYHSSVARRYHNKQHPTQQFHLWCSVIIRRERYTMKKQNNRFKRWGRSSRISANDRRRQRGGVPIAGTRTNTSSDDHRIESSIKRGWYE
jgi:hypothetical protein